MIEEKHCCPKLTGSADEEVFEITGYPGAVMLLIVKPDKYMLEIIFCPFCGEKLI